MLPGPASHGHVVSPSPRSSLPCPSCHIHIQPAKCASAHHPHLARPPACPPAGRPPEPALLRLHLLLTSSLRRAGHAAGQAGGRLEGEQAQAQAGQWAAKHGFKGQHHTDGHRWVAARRTTRACLPPCAAPPRCLRSMLRTARRSWWSRGTHPCRTTPSCRVGGRVGGWGFRGAACLLRCACWGGGGAGGENDAPNTSAQHC